jgi:hypothetical protein
MVGNVDIIAIQRMRGGHFFLPCNLIRKRTAFPSGESGALSLMITAWFRHRKLSPNVEFAGGDRFQRSVRLCS